MVSGRICPLGRRLRATSSAEQCNPNADSHPNRHAHQHADRDGHQYPNRDADRDGHKHADQHTDLHANQYGDGDGHPYANRHAADELPSLSTHHFGKSLNFIGNNFAPGR